MSLFDALPVPDETAAAHPLLLVTCAPMIGWWAECECGWIGPGYLTERRASASHARHVHSHARWP